MKVHICLNNYSAWFDECKARTKRGEKQLHCGLCGLWRWPGECEHARSEMLTTRQFNAMVKRTAKQVRRAYPTQEDKYRNQTTRPARKSRKT